jgi:photosystem II stability/assembly factor-like uncharacterized protein
MEMNIMRLQIPPLLIIITLLSGCQQALDISVAAAPQPRRAKYAQPAPRANGTSLAESRQTLIPTPELPAGPAMPELSAGRPINISTIQMLDTQNGWGIGHQGESSDHILFTQDGGLTWVDRSPPESAVPDAKQKAWAYFRDHLYVWVIYGPEAGTPPLEDPHIWFTNDGGQSWHPSQPLATAGAESFFIPEGFAFIDETHGWLLVHVDAGMSHDYSYLYATENGGQTWERIADPYGSGLQSLHNTGIGFADKHFGWVTKNNLGVMAGAFFEQTTDGGFTWEQVFLPAPSELDWFEELSLCQTSSPTFPSFQTASLIVKCRLSGDQTIDYNAWSLTFIYTSLDRGSTWEYAQLPSAVDSLLFLDTQTGWAFGRDTYKTSDGGLSWVPIKSVNWDGQFNFINEAQGWAVATNEGDSALVTTLNGGQSWQIITPEME